MPRRGSGRPQEPVSEPAQEDESSILTVFPDESTPQDEAPAEAPPALEKARPEPETPPAPETPESEAEPQQPDTAELERQIGRAQAVLGEKGLDPEQVYRSFEDGQNALTEQRTLNQTQSQEIQRLGEQLQELQSASKGPAAPSREAILQWAASLRDPNFAKNHLPAGEEAAETPEGRMAQGEALAWRQMERAAAQDQGDPKQQEQATVLQALTAAVFELQAESKRGRITKNVPGYEPGDPQVVQQLSQLMTTEDALTAEQADIFQKVAPALMAYAWQGKFGGQASTAQPPAVPVPADNGGIMSTAAAAASRMGSLRQSPRAPTGTEPGVVTQEDQAMWDYHFKAAAQQGLTSFKTVQEFAAERRKLEAGEG